MSPAAAMAVIHDRDVLVPAHVDPALPAPGSCVHVLDGTTMGTSWSARFVLPAAASCDVPGQLRAALQAELDTVVTQMSHWEPDSLLSRFNRAPAGSWHDLPQAFFDVMDYALGVHAASGGACDPAAGALVNLWGFGPRATGHGAGFYAPPGAAIDAVRARVAAARPVLDRAGRRLLQPGGAVLDLSAVAKGYAVDCLGRCLARHGVPHYLVEIGGELRGEGVKPGGEPWWVEVEAVPDAAAGPPPLVALHGLAIATSGDYRRFHRAATGRWAHTLDPRNGRPIANGVASCTVLAETCMAADALSTALTVLGPAAGLAFAARSALPARFLLRTDGGAVLEERTSPAWRALLQ